VAVAALPVPDQARLADQRPTQGHRIRIALVDQRHRPFVALYAADQDQGHVHAPFAHLLCGITVVVCQIVIRILSQVSLYLVDSQDRPVI
jgi:hypothetical protein